MSYFRLVQFLVVGTMVLGITNPCLIDLVSGESRMTPLRIGTGRITGLYYPTGSAISRLINEKIKDEAGFKLTEQSLANLKEDELPKKILKNLESLKNKCYNEKKKFLSAVKQKIGEDQSALYKEQILKHAEGYKRRAVVEATAGSKENVQKLKEGKLDFAIIQFNDLYLDKNSEAEREICAMFNLYTELVTLAALDVHIKKFEDLLEQSISIGSDDTGYQENAKDILQAFCLNNASISDECSKDKEKCFTECFRSEKRLKINQVSSALQDEQIDAFFYTAGHPSVAIKEATTGARKVRLIEIPKDIIERLVDDKKYYLKTRIPVKYHPQIANTEDVNTIGVKATFVAKCDSPCSDYDCLVEDIVEVMFENFEKFKTFHPAYEKLTKDSMAEGLPRKFLHEAAYNYYLKVGLKP